MFLRDCEVPSHFAIRAPKTVLHAELIWSDGRQAGVRLSQEAPSVYPAVDAEPAS